METPLAVLVLLAAGNSRAQSLSQAMTQATAALQASRAAQAPRMSAEDKAALLSEIAEIQSGSLNSLRQGINELADATPRAGIAFETIAGKVTVVFLRKGSPAAASGLKPGDVVVAVNGYIADGMGAEDVRFMIGRAERVELMVRSEDGKTRTFRFAKRDLSIPSARYAPIDAAMDSLGDSVDLVARTVIAGSVTAAEARAALAQLHAQYGPIQEQWSQEAYGLTMEQLIRRKVELDAAAQRTPQR